MELGEAITHLGLAGSVPGLSAAVDRSEQIIGKMRAAFTAFETDGAMDVVAFGSLARREYTQASDVDYLVLVDTMPSDPMAPRALLQLVKDRIADEAESDGAPKGPGTTGLFGKAIGIFDVINQVGLEGDTNFTHTIRMEIIQESISLRSEQLHSKILDSTLQRYISLFEVPNQRPPRFLLNDMIRYWRQITVDYQAKAPVGAAEEQKAVLRFLKLQTTRKNFIASSILPLIAPRDDSIAWERYLHEIYSIPPLARLAKVTEGAPEQVLEAVRTVFRTIDLFVQRTDSRDKRLVFEEIPWDTRKNDSGYVELSDAAKELQSAYECIFFDWPVVAKLTRSHLVL